MKQNIVIIGAGDLGLQLLHHLKLENKIEVIGWLDDTMPKGKIVSGIEVLGKIKDFEKLKNNIQFIVAIGYNGLKFKQKLIKKIKEKDKKLYTFIHSSAIIDSSAQIDDGVIIYPGCIIDMNVKIESGALLNNGVIISHDGMIKECSFIAPGVVIAGNVIIGQRCFIGSGSTFKNDLILSNDITIGSGTNVYKSISQKGVYTQNLKLTKHI